MKHGTPRSRSRPRPRPRPRSPPACARAEAARQLSPGWRLCAACRPCAHAPLVRLPTRGGGDCNPGGSRRPGQGVFGPRRRAAARGRAPLALLGLLLLLPALLSLLPLTICLLHLALRLHPAALATPRLRLRRLRSRRLTEHARLSATAISSAWMSRLLQRRLRLSYKYLVVPVSLLLLNLSQSGVPGVQPNRSKPRMIAVRRTGAAATGSGVSASVAGSARACACAARLERFGTGAWLF